MSKFYIFLLLGIIITSCGFFTSKKSNPEKSSADASQHTMDQEDITAPTLSYHSTVILKMTKSEENDSNSSGKKILIKINLSGLSESVSVSKIQEKFSLGYCIGQAGEENSCHYTLLKDVSFSDKVSAQTYLPDDAYNKDVKKSVFVKARYCDQGTCNEVILTYGVSDSYVVVDSSSSKSNKTDIDMNQSGPEFGSEK